MKIKNNIKGTSKMRIKSILLISVMILLVVAPVVQAESKLQMWRNASTDANVSWVDNNGNWFMNGNLNISGTIFGNTSIWSKSGTNIFPTTLTDNVGIGTSSPNSLLHIKDSSSTFANINIEGNQSGDVGWLLMSGYPNAGDFNIRQSDVGNFLTIKKTTGNVGIGTTSPARLLDVNGIADINGIVIGTNADSIYHNDSDFYIKTESAHDLRFRTNNTNRMVINGSSGNVGIGTTAPLMDLSIQEGATTSLASSASGGGMIITASSIPRIYFEDAGEGSGDKLMDIHYDAESLTISSLTDAANTYDVQNIAVFNRDGKVGIGTTIPDYKLDVAGDIAGESLKVGVGVATMVIEPDASNKDLYLKTTNGGSADLFIESDNGNVGIGTTSPSDKLSVKDGNITIDANTAIGKIVGLRFTEDNFIGSMALRYNGSGTGDTGNAMQIYDEANDIARVSFQRGGNVGIGTTSPSNLLHIYRDNADITQQIRMEQDGAGDVSLGFVLTDTAGWTMGIDNSDTDKFKIGLATDLTDSNIMTLMRTGNVGIGTTSPAATLDVQNNLAGIYAAKFLNSNADGHGVWIKANNSDTNRGSLVVSNDVGVNLYVRNDGNVGIGTSSPTSKLDIQTSASATWATSIANTAANGHGLIITAGGTTGTRYITQWKDKDGTERFHMDDTGEAYFQNNVGIGTNSPGKLLHLKTDGVSRQLRFEENGAAAYWDMGVNTAGDFSLVQDATDTILFVESSNGNVGINTTTPQNTLNVLGDLNVTGTLYTGTLSATTQTATNLWVSNNATIGKNLTVGGNSLFVDAESDRVGIGTTSPNSKLQVNSTADTIAEFTETGASRGTVMFRGAESQDMRLLISADENDDSADGWEIESVASDNSLGFKNVALSSNTLTMDNSGNVGIGTTSPNYDLHIIDNSRNTGTEPILKLESEHVSSDGVFYGLNIAPRDIQYYANGSTTGTNMLLSTNKETLWSTPTAGSIQFAPNESVAMTLLIGGNVGIGTTTPQNTLNVLGDANVTGTLYTGTLSTTTQTATNLWVSNNATIGKNLTVGGNSLFVDAESDRVGIGTTSPIIDFQIVDTTGAHMILNSNTGGVSSGIYMTESAAATATSGGAYVYYDGSANDFNIAVGSGTPIDRLTIGRDSGNVGINTSSPNAGLHIQNGDILIANDAATGGTGIARLLFSEASGASASTAMSMNYNGDSYSGAANKIYFANNTAGNELFRIEQGGDIFADATTLFVDASENMVGIGTTSPSEQFHVSGGKMVISSTDNSYGQIRVMNTADGEASIGYFTGWSSGDTATKKWAAGVGVYALGSDGWGIGNAVDGAAIFTVKEGGNVGIGTTTPDELLHIYQTADDFAVLHVENTNAGSSAGSEIQLENNLGDNFWVVNHGSGRTGVSRYGIPVGNWSELLAQQSEGLMIGAGSSDTPIVFGNNDLERMRIAAGGNIGIGTTTPTQELEVASTNPQIRLKDTDGAGDAATGWLEFVDSGDTRVGYVGLGTGSNDNVYLNADSGDIYLRTNTASEVLTVTQAGKVGIGTKTPQNTLNVLGDANVTGTLYTGALSATTQTATNLWVSNNATIGKNLSVDTNTLFVNAENDRVGIGTTSPNVKLVVDGSIGLDYGTGTSYQGIRRSGVATEYYNGVTSTGTFVIHNFTGSGGASKMVIREDGNVGIGTTSPRQTTHINGDNNDVLYLSAGVSDDVSISFDEENSGTVNAKIYWDASVNNFNFATSSADVITINGTSNNVGIGTTSPSDTLNIVSSTAYTGITLNDSTYNVARLLHNGANDGYLLLYSAGNPTTLIHTGGDSYFNGGNVGIGTTTPTNLLNVLGDANVTGTLYTGTLSATTQTATNLWVSNNATIGKNLSVDTNTLFVDAESNMVGIGTSSPNAPLHVLKTTADTSTVQNVARLEAYSSGNIADGFGAGITFQVDDGGMSPSVAGKIYGIRDGADTEGALAFYAGTSGNEEFMRIDNDGHVGINTTTPLNALDVVGDVMSTRVGTTSGISRTSKAYLEARVPIPSVKTAGELGMTFTDENDINNNIAGERDSLIACTDGVNYASAKSTVEAVGARLPTLEELEGGAVEGMGCSFDYYYIWTQTKCDVSGVNDSIVNYYWISVGDPANTTLTRYCVAETATTPPAGHLSGYNSIAVSYVAEIDKGGLPAITDSAGRIRSNNIWSTNASGLILGDDAGNGIFVEDGGQIGIGTSTPDSKLQLLSNTGTALHITNLNNDASATGINITDENGGNYFWVRSTGDGGTLGESYFAGNVGIGTTSPEHLLHIKSATSAASGQYTSPNSLYISSDASAAGVGGTILFAADGTAAKNTHASIYSSNTASDSTGSVANLQFATKENKADTTLTPRMTIKPDGNVGIGTTAPSQLLHIKSASPGIRLEDSDTGGSAGYFIYDGGLIKIASAVGATGVKFSIADNAPDDSMYIAATTGNVGIGTTSPGHTLTVQSGATGGADVNLSNTLFVNGSNVGIGTTAPAQKLHTYSAVSGENVYTLVESAHATNWGEAGISFKTPQNQWYLRMDDDSNNNMPDGGLGLWSVDLNADVMVWNGTTGNVGIGNTAPASKLEVTGSFNASTSGGSIKLESDGDVRIGI